VHFFIISPLSFRAENNPDHTNYQLPPSISHLQPDVHSPWKLCNTCPFQICLHGTVHKLLHVTLAPTLAFASSCRDGVSGASNSCFQFEAPSLQSSPLPSSRIRALVQPSMGSFQVLEITSYDVVTPGQAKARGSSPPPIVVPPTKEAPPLAPILVPTLNQPPYDQTPFTLYPLSNPYGCRVDWFDLHENSLRYAPPPPSPPSRSLLASLSSLFPIHHPPSNLPPKILLLLSTVHPPQPFLCVGVQICSIYILHSFKCQSRIHNQ
jgi:hypothetical protein